MREAFVLSPTALRFGAILFSPPVLDLVSWEGFASGAFRLAPMSTPPTGSPARSA
jgi:hypothetical protein